MDKSEMKTVYYSEEDNEEAVTVRYEADENVNDANQMRTVSRYQAEEKADAVTGWLVCVEGDKRGASYRLVEGRNFIGRALDMDVCFSDDEMVCRVNHCSVVYDDRENMFYLVPGGGSVQLEDKIIKQAEVLETDMKVKIGKSKFVFIAYCNEGRVWK